MYTIVLITMVLVIFYMWYEAYRNRVEKLHLAFPHFPKGFGQVAIFFISDVHRRTISNKVIDAVRGKADIVVIGGDLTERGVPFKRVADNVRRLKELGPVFFVWGNNDYEVNYHELDALLLEEGVKILDNTAVTFETHGGEKWTLIGVDDISKSRDRLDLAVAEASDEGFRILVCHNPRIVKKLQNYHRISLVLSGHTHGGQIRIFNMGLYENGGIQQLDSGTTVLVSNGYGTTGVPFRLGAPAQTHLITIRSSSNGEVL